MNYEAYIGFRADSWEDAQEIFDRMMDALGCTDDPDHDCRLGVAALHALPTTRRGYLRRLIRTIRIELSWFPWRNEDLAP